MRYKKKPVVIEAFQYDGDLKGSDGNYYVPKWAVEAFESETMFYDSLDCNQPPCDLFIKTLEGNMLVGVDDYVIQGVEGELYPCKPNIFEKTYDAVVDLCDECPDKETCANESWLQCPHRIEDED